jgi:hypothetical protein
MIARHVHNHTPQLQLERPEFKQYIVENNQKFQSISDKNNIKINIDKMSSLQ